MSHNNTAKANILLGVCAGIAAYKSAYLVRLLRAQGHCVQVVLTPSATKFVSPLTFSALCGRAAQTDLFDKTGMAHIDLARFADMIIIAPATANTLAKLAHGLADNLLTNICLATTAPIIAAPAMNMHMWQNMAVQKNIALMRQRGIMIAPPDSGEQACGDVGVGRMMQPEKIVQFMQDYRVKNDISAIYNTNGKACNKNTPLRQKTVLITAGATIEAIDPVRYLSNHSTGKMGIALAKACQSLGANVVLVCGKNVVMPIPDGIQKIVVTDAKDMLNACQMHITQSDIFISCAAVADFCPKNYHPQKLKKDKNSNTFTLELVKNVDILRTLAAQHPNVFMVGFAAETQNTHAYAKQKLIDKKLDMIVLNDVSNPNIGMSADDNAVTVFAKDGTSVYFDVAPKSQIGQLLANTIADKYNAFLQTITNEMNDDKVGV